MSIESPPETERKSKERPPKVRETGRNEGAQTSWPERLADACLIALFLTLTFLLGVFPLKDADIYWHLKTGDWMRQMGQVPRFDLFTFTRGPSVPWIDLHWLFQIAISGVYQYGGVVALNLAKCAVTCVAMLFLVTARKREWPVSVMILAWLPALLVLGGRMYVRPETLTLLYLSIFLAVILRWDRYAWLALLLPIVQVAWVNSHGLFVLGPILVAFGLIDAALRFGFFAPERRGWWRTILVASLLTGGACLINPYVLTGALYPLELAGTMSNPIFSHNVAELTTIPDFLRSAGLWNLPMQLHLLTMALGALSFFIPLVWLIKIRLAGNRPFSSGEAEPPHDSRERTSKGKKRSRLKSSPNKGAKDNQTPAIALDPVPGWRLSPFRLLLFLAFSALSLQATRNSHQFAAVVGTITAWNFGEWAAFLRRRRLTNYGASPISSARSTRLVAFGAVILVLLWVGSGLFYRMTGEGRVISLKEDPLFFPHEAARFAGEPGMSDRFLSFHNGHAALFEYYHGPDRKVYTDPRLEVAGADLFKRYMALENLLKKDLPGWEAQLNEMGRPVILVDHEYNSEIGGTLFRSDHWRCVWFDAIAAVFVHDSNLSVVRAHAVDFAARHFRPDPKLETQSVAELTAAAKAFRTYAPTVSPPGGALRQQLTFLGLDNVRRVLRRLPDSFDAWKLMGQMELFRDLVPDQSSPRFRSSFDPVLDLSMVRATYALRRASELGPHDFSMLISLRLAYDARRMYEAALTISDRVASLHPTNLYQSGEQAKNEVLRAEYLRKLGSPPATTWSNLSDLDQIVTAQLDTGRAESAAVLLERAYPPEKASWEMIDKMATLRLHLGESPLARELWRKATTTPGSGIQDSRIGTTYLVEGDFDAARRFYQQALHANPNLFEAHYCLAELEQDAGHARPAYDQAILAIKAAQDDSARSAARAIAAGVARFARGANAEDVAPK
jgi:tetratricopeptide (TPR) repeat protein